MIRHHELPAPIKKCLIDAITVVISTIPCLPILICLIIRFFPASAQLLTDVNNRLFFGIEATSFILIIMLLTNYFNDFKLKIFIATVFSPLCFFMIGVCEAINFTDVDISHKICAYVASAILLVFEIFAFVERSSIERSTFDD